MQAKRFELIIAKNHPGNASEALARHSGLSRTKVKAAMRKGAVWLQQSGSKPRRVRRATTAVRPGQHWILYYDPAILDLEPPQALCLHDYRSYSIWFKPSGLMTQGTRYGDHCSLERQVEMHFQSRRQVYLIHRIDREAAGLLIVGHNREAASSLSSLLRRQQIEKSYLAWVLGDLARRSRSGTIDLPLDGKEAVTHYESLQYDAAAGQSLLRLHLQTGRLHQIRRHLAMIGFPVMGDPRYGRGNKNSSGLQLVAYCLEFECPFGKGRIKAFIDPWKVLTNESAA